MHPDTRPTVERPIFNQVSVALGCVSRYHLDVKITLFHSDCIVCLELGPHATARGRRAVRGRSAPVGASPWHGGARGAWGGGLAPFYYV